MNKDKGNIAIFGGTGHIAKGLIYSFCSDKRWKVYVFSRNIEKVQKFLQDEALEAVVVLYDAFERHDYDIIINCIGIGEPSKLLHGYIEQFNITEHYDNKILSYLHGKNSVVYVNLSSGAAYNSDFLVPVQSTSVAEYHLQNIEKTEYYGMSKLYSEYKHRALSQFHIVDIRVFSYFSRFIQEDSGFFLADIIRSMRTKSVLQVSDYEIWRDYVSYDELYELIVRIYENPRNTSCDIYSKKPISKVEILNFLKEEFQLSYTYTEHMGANPTGVKPYYYSESRQATTMFGYMPKRTSQEVLRNQLYLIFS